MTLYGVELTEKGIIVAEDMGSASLTKALKNKPEILMADNIREEIVRISKKAADFPVRVHSLVKDSSTTIVQLSYGEVKLIGE